jgi:hypothetical protein
MADWTTVAVAGISAGAGVVGGVLGFYGARLQARTGLAQAQLQASVGIRQADAETQRLREQLAETHLTNRQGAYHQFLNHERRLAKLFEHGSPPIEPEAWSAWQDEFLNLFNALILFGTEEVRDEVADFRRLVSRFTFDFFKRIDDKKEPFEVAIRHEYGNYFEPIWEARERVANAMRNDVAPERRLPHRDVES